MDFQLQINDYDRTITFKGALTMRDLALLPRSDSDQAVIDNAFHEDAKAHNVLLALSLLYLRHAEQQRATWLATSADPSMGQGVGRQGQERERP